MRFFWKQGEPYLYAGEKKIRCSCVVRNELNGWRPLPDKPAQDEVVTTLPDHKPYMPRIFPEGVWSVGRPEPRSHPYKAPYYIPTNAYQYLPIWKLNADGEYSRQTDELVRDEDYGLHCSSSNTTLGCIKIHQEADLIWMVETINRLMDHGEQVFMEVSA